MDVTMAADAPFLSRLLTTPLERAVEEFPVTVVTGARQTGKSTLVREVANLGDRRYLTLDDFDVRARAEEAPAALVRGTGDLTLDEVHRSPEARARWFDGYVQTYLERDVPSLRDVEHLPEFRRLMRATCLRPPRWRGPEPKARAESVHHSPIENHRILPD